MSKTIKPPLPGHRLSVAEAKARLSEALRQVEDGPTVIHNRGRDAAVLIGIDAYQRLLDGSPDGGAPMAAFLRDVAELKARLGGADFTPEPATLTPHDPFARTRR